MPPLRLIYLMLAILGGSASMHTSFSWLILRLRHERVLEETLPVGPEYADSYYIVWSPEITIATIALTIFVLAEALPRRDWLGLAAIPATFGLGLSCGLPLYLFLRSRKEI